MTHHGRPQNSCARKMQRAQMVAAQLCGIPPAFVVAGPRAGADVAFARQLAMYLTNRVYGVGRSQTAAMFGRAPAAATYACRRIETLRQNPRFDWQVFEVETLLRAADLLDDMGEPR